MRLHRRGSRSYREGVGDECSEVNSRALNAPGRKRRAVECLLRSRGRGKCADSGIATGQFFAFKLKMIYGNSSIMAVDEVATSMIRSRFH